MVPSESLCVNFTLRLVRRLQTGQKRQKEGELLLCIRIANFVQVFCTALLGYVPMLLTNTCGQHRLSRPLAGALAVTSMVTPKPNKV